MKTYRVVKSAKGCSFTYHAVLPADTDNKAILAIRDDVLGEISNGVDVTADFKRSAAKSVSIYQEAVADTIEEYFEYFEEYDLDSIYPVFVADGFIVMAYFSFYEISTAPRNAMEYHYKMYDLATGKRMTEKEIFNDTHKAKEVIEKYIWEQTTEWQSGDEDDASQITNEDVFNGNYYVSDDKFFVCYNSSVYFIPGGIDIEIPKEAMKPYMKKDCPIYKYWFGEK
jgi:predicted Zn-dependent protease